MKTGRLTREEQEFILNNYESKTPSDIASTLDRRVEAILDFIQKIPNKKIQSNIDSLKNRPFWSELEEQFLPAEINQFADEYAGFIKQFEGEILHSEEIQIIDAIRIGLLANRALREEKKLIDIISKIELDLGKEKIKKVFDDEKIGDLEHNLALHKQLQHKSSERYENLIDTKLKALEKLKATREKREDAKNSAFKTNFKDWIKRLIEDADLREEMGKYAEKMRIAADLEYKRLTQLHRYQDKILDVPILNSETVHLLINIDDKQE